MRSNSVSHSAAVRRSFRSGRIKQWVPLLAGSLVPASAAMADAPLNYLVSHGIPTRSISLLTWFMMIVSISVILASARRTTPMLLLLLFTSGLLAGCDRDQPGATQNFQGDAKRGKTLVAAYGCGNCHLIPKVAGADGNVGPPLMHMATRVYIAGFVRNSPENMSVWLQDPQKILPGNAMPAMGISRKDSHDITAFLYSLK